MTPRQLREALYYIQNQKMTVRQLRDMLFDIEDQDAEIVMGYGVWQSLEESFFEQDDRWQAEDSGKIVTAKTTN